jgi:2-phosphosulfolactate phosphatase
MVALGPLEASVLVRIQVGQPIPTPETRSRKLQFLVGAAPSNQHRIQHMTTQIEVLFAPAEFDALRHRDLSASVCVVFDVLRATSSMITALAHGADAVIPVAEIEEALVLWRRNPQALLAGERDGTRILASQTGGVDFPLGNSPREYTPERVRGKTIVTTTTNGTRALRACAGAKAVLVGCFLNLPAIARWLVQARPQTLWLVCSGTFEQAALEDVLAAGALADRIWPVWGTGDVADSTRMARWLFQQKGDCLEQNLAEARNGQRLLSRADLRADVAFCCQQGIYDFAAGLEPDGAVRRWPTA